MKTNMGISVNRLYEIYNKFLEKVRCEVKLRYKESNTETEEIMSEIIRYIHFILYE